MENSLFEVVGQLLSREGDATQTFVVWQKGTLEHCQNWLKSEIAVSEDNMACIQGEWYILTVSEAKPPVYYKLVDTFNGWEDDRRFSSWGEAKAVLEGRHIAFRKHAATSNCVFCEAIAEASAEWAYDYHQNRFRWFPEPAA